MSIYDRLETSKEIEKSGVEFEPYPGDGIFLCARAGGSNVKFKKALEKATRHLRGSRLNQLDEAQAVKISMEAFVDHVLLGWKEVTGRDGKEIKYSKAEAIKLFKDLPDLFSILQEMAADSQYFLKELREEKGKNS